MLSDELQEKLVKRIDGILVGKEKERKSQKGIPEPTLVESEVDYKDYLSAISLLEDLYNKSEIVHADFSEYNIFKTKKGLLVFDFGSAVDIRHPNAMEFLERDIKNMTRFFVKRGLAVENPIDILKRIIK